MPLLIDSKARTSPENGSIPALRATVWTKADESHHYNFFLSLYCTLNRFRHEQAETPSISFCPFPGAGCGLWHRALYPGHEGKCTRQNRTVERFHRTDSSRSGDVFRDQKGQGRAGQLTLAISVSWRKLSKPCPDKTLVKRCPACGRLLRRIGPSPGRFDGRWSRNGNGSGGGIRPFLQRSVLRNAAFGTGYGISLARRPG